MNKPTIPIEVADAIEHLRNKDVFDPVYTNGDIVYSVLDSSTSASTFATLRTIPFDTLMTALVNGYERELTEEQRVHAIILEEFEDHRRGNGGFETGGEDRAFAAGIKFTLNTLNIDIEGVNA